LVEPKNAKLIWSRRAAERQRNEEIHAPWRQLMGHFRFPSSLVASKAGFIAEIKSCGLFACGYRRLILYVYGWRRRDLVARYEKRDGKNDNDASGSGGDDPSRSPGAHLFAVFSAADFEEFRQAG
jgi:hypothetical protein